MALSSGTKLGPYEIQNSLGAGGMGEVYRARDTHLERTVAIKILPAHLSSHAELKARFEREARAVDREWLYPERRVSTTEWRALDDNWFLLPHLWKVGFTGGIYAGGDNGPTFAADEYGRHP